MKAPNHLAQSTSPYLRQHAHNPVDWYEWGPEALTRARVEDKPILLSVGYSACHWCHVMAHESFENESIAALMNEHFINIKVDREERPDIDAIYQKVVALMGQGGGWPLTVFLTPDQRPFYGGTYFPAADRYGRPGFPRLLQSLAQLWRDRRDEALAQAEAFMGGFADIAAGIDEDAAGGVDLRLASRECLAEASRRLLGQIDPEWGGFGRAPKFPNVPALELMLTAIRAGLDEHDELGEALRSTLGAMWRGGIYDHLRGGFARYSVDRQWLIPHFEKMLYDNALLVPAYLEGFQATGKQEFARVARETLRFLERDMSAPEGAFYSAIDADSPVANGRMKEGAFYNWTPAEIEAALDPRKAEIVIRYFGVTQKGNFEGRSILHVPVPPAVLVRELGIQKAELEALLEEAKELLYRARSRRPAPIRDEKILAAWNGLAISAFARAGFVLDEPGYVERASRAARFLLERLFKDGRLHRTWKDGEARHLGLLEDHAFLVAGLLDLYEASGDISRLKEAAALDAVIEERFEDRERGGFFLTGEGHEALLVREKPMYDGAEPSGTSVALLNLLRLHEFTTEARYRERAEKALRYASPTLKSSPIALSEMLLALDFYLDKPKQIVVVLPRKAGRETSEPLLSAIRGKFVPNRILSVVREGKELEKAAEIIPLVRGKEASGGKATAYVCEERTCKPPTGEPAELLKQVG